MSQDGTKVWSQDDGKEAATEQMGRLEGRTGYLSAWECVGIFQVCRSWRIE